MATSTSPSTDKVKFSTLLPLYQSSMKGKLSLRSRSQRTRQCNLEDNKTVEVPVENALAVPKENLPRNPSQQSLSSVPTTPQPGIEPTKEGYLFKRSHNKFKTWSRRWFSIRNGQLLYMKRNNATSTNDSAQQPSLPQSIMVPDLRLCSIRSANDIDRRFVFEILSPNSSHLLQADSQAQCEQWVSSLQLAIKNSFKSSNDNSQNSASSSPKSNDESSNALQAEKAEIKQKMIREKIEYVRCLPGNDKCCDCNADGPEWASINIGILLCLNCGGAHRGLGVNLSKVRSLHMDTWDLETLLIMSELGNTVVNEIYEAQLSNGMQKPNADSDAVTRRAFIESKYVQKAFLRSLPSQEDIPLLPRRIKKWPIMKQSISDESSSKRTTSSSSDSDKNNQDSSSSIWNMNIYLYEGARHHNVMMMLHALALGADKNFANEHDGGRTPLIQAILSRSVAAADFLLTNNAKVNLPDQAGKTPLHYATQLTNKGRGPIILLIKRGADPLLKDKDGIDACSVSMDVGDPDVITWYRLVALHEQMKEEDADAEKTYISILDDGVYMKEIARTPSFS